jgi:hypothetical protein
MRRLYSNVELKYAGFVCNVGKYYFNKGGITNSDSFRRRNKSEFISRGDSVLSRCFPTFGRRGLEFFRPFPTTPFETRLSINFQGNHAGEENAWGSLGHGS